MAELDPDWQGVSESQPDLHQAVSHDNVSLLKYLIEIEGIPVDLTNSWGFTPLRTAVKAKAVNCLEYLLKNGASVDKSDRKAQTPLFFAVYCGYTEAVKRLLSAGACPDGDFHNLCSPLYSAAMHGELEILKLLIEHGAVLDSVVSSSFTSTPLCTSAIHQHWDCFAALLKAGAKPAAVGAKKSLFHILVVRNAPKEMVELLWEAGGSVYTRDQINTYPHEALNNKHSELLLHYWNTPRRLMSACRVCIRQLMGRTHLTSIGNLPLPSKLIEYLEMREFELV